MDATVEQLGDVVIAELRAAGYMESTIGQYQKTIRTWRGYSLAAARSSTRPRWGPSSRR